MSSIARAVSSAAAIFCAGYLLGTTSPGLAHDLNRAPISTINALTLPQVPLTTPAVTPATAYQPEAVVPPAAVQTLTVNHQVLDGPSGPVASAEPDYSSLADAVAAQDHSAEDRELRCLASGVFYESNGEPLAGQLAVAQTILNRTKSGRFPKSVCSVLTQRGQFSFVRGGVVPTAEGRGGWKTAVAVAKVAVRDLWDGAADRALYFHARRVAPGWRMTKIAAIGNHVFYR